MKNLLFVFVLCTISILSCQNKINPYITDYDTLEIETYTDDLDSIFEDDYIKKIYKHTKGDTSKIKRITLKNNKLYFLWIYECDMTLQSFNINYIFNHSFPKWDEPEHQERYKGYYYAFDILQPITEEDVYMIYDYRSMFEEVSSLDELKLKFDSVRNEDFYNFNDSLYQSIMFELDSIKIFDKVKLNTYKEIKQNYIDNGWIK